MTAARTSALGRLDAAVLRGTRARLGGSPAVPLARGLSGFGEHALGWIALGGVGWATGRRRHEWGTGVAGVVAAHAAAVALKRVVRRSRPALPDVPPLERTASLLSFPSAHATSTAAAAVGFAPMVGAAPMAAVTGGMLASRVLLGVHWPSDVVAGALLGSSVAALVRRAARAQ